MAERKYQKYIVETTRIPESVTKKDVPSTAAGKIKRVIWLDERVVEGSFFLNLSWYMKPLGIEGEVGHTHDFDEVLGFIGSDWNNPRELNGEVEFWLEDEKYILTKSSVIFIPKGMKHCPLKCLRADRPIIHFGTGPQRQYIRAGE
jgi:hypothetical protein